MRSRIKNIIRKILEFFCFGRKLFYGRSLYKKLLEIKETEKEFLSKHWDELWVEKIAKEKADQISALIKRVNIASVDNNTFFYSIDYFKTVKNKYDVLGNCTVNYQNIILSSLNKKYKSLSYVENEFSYNEKTIIEAMYDYYRRLTNSAEIRQKYDSAINAIGTLFERPAGTLYEGLQRILFFNQFLWQTGHKLNGLGRLDLLLITLYENDINTGRLTAGQAKEYIKDFFYVLHEGYWFKSNMLRGDTGQIIILGGLDADNCYVCNELTYLFIDVLMELKLPDPKILLRCSCKMPDKLLRLALKCVSTGIGAPIFSNDDVVIPALLSYGYDKEDVYNYITAACWEPAIPDCSSELSNAGTFNFAKPFVEMFNNQVVESITSIDQLLSIYKRYLQRYTYKLLTSMSKMKLEPDPIISLLSDSAQNKMKDITRGGAKYYNIGLTSVGIGSVVNSILNINDIVFKEEKYTMKQLNEARNNYAQYSELRQKLKDRRPCFGSDDREVISLTKQILDMASEEFEKYKTVMGGKFKFGLSSPNYITSGERTEATFDGRMDGEPFSVHISSQMSIALTELLNFAMNLDYKKNRINGNVVDFIVSPLTLENSFEKYILLLKAGIAGGIFQLQMNVVSSKTLIEARKNPEKFPNLIVRVWGFSAYFNDLPDEYKEVLIMRAMESEKAA